VPILPREPQVQPADAVGGDGAVEGVVARAPDHALARIRGHFRPAQVVGVHHVHLPAAHQAHRLAAGQAQVVRPGTPAPGVLGLHLTAGAVHEPHPGRRAPVVLADALAQGIDPVIGGHATAGDLVQAVEAVVTIRVAAAGGGVAAGVGAVARRAGAGDGRQAVAAGVDAVEVGPGRLRVAGPVAVGVVGEPLVRPGRGDGRQAHQRVVGERLGQAGAHAIGDLADAVVVIERVGQVLPDRAAGGDLDGGQAAAGVEAVAAYQAVAVGPAGHRAERAVPEPRGHVLLGSAHGDGHGVEAPVAPVSVADADPARVGD